MSRMRVCVVCLGNICRSPLGEAALRAEAEAAGMEIEVDSAGTGGWHAGEAPDVRSIRAAERVGMDISSQRARQLTSEDLDAFDWILAMDEQNKADILALGESRARVALFLPEGGAVPDPYYQDDAAFDRVVALVRPAASVWISRWKTAP